MTAPRQLPATAGQTSAENPWPVRLLTAKLTEYIAKAPGVWVEGQVVQLVRRPGQATCYLTLRDTDVDLSFSVSVHARVLDDHAVPLADGAHVVVHARPELYPRRGSLSLSADVVRPVGVGELLARLEHLRRVLASEGLFDVSRKRPLPFLPKVVGLVCGRASAAEKDVVENARRRWPGVRFAIRQVAVQGTSAVTEVIDAIIALDRDPDVEVIVVARGGGSLEDLLPFSNEALVRVAADCLTPIVSAIGHEVDTPLLDLVADVRASTPTDAAKRIVPDVAAEAAALAAARDRSAAAVRARIARESQLMTDARARLGDPMRLLERPIQQCADLRSRLSVATLQRIGRAGDDLVHLRERVHALSPGATLARGYSVTLTVDGDVVRTPADAPPGAQLLVHLAHGRLAAQSLGDAATAQRPAPGTPTATDTPTGKAAPTGNAAPTTKGTTARKAAPRKQAAKTRPAPTSENGDLQ